MGFNKPKKAGSAAILLFLLTLIWSLGVTVGASGTPRLFAASVHQRRGNEPADDDDSDDEPASGMMPGMMPGVLQEQALRHRSDSYILGSTQSRDQ